MGGDEKKNIRTRENVLLLLHHICARPAAANPGAVSKRGRKRKQNAGKSPQRTLTGKFGFTSQESGEKVAKAGTADSPRQAKSRLGSGSSDDDDDDDDDDDGMTQGYQPQRKQ